MSLEAIRSLNADAAAQFSVADAIGRDWPCSCGHTHRTAIRAYRVAHDIAAQLPELLQELGYARPYLVMDVHTERVQGAAVRAALQAAGFEAPSFVFPDDELVPDEHAIALLDAAVATCETQPDLWIAVGSGTLNDLVRYVSHRRDQPYLVVATAPSMDGYASGVSPLILERMKQTFPARSPLAILADPAVLAAAPDEMLAAGVGDVLGKFTSLADWQLARLIIGEGYCPFVARRVALSRDHVLEQIPAIVARDEKAVEALFNALVEVGVAMDYNGDSRPASGAEHHLAHFWEMQHLFAAQPIVLHGRQVAYGALLIADLWWKLPDRPPTSASADADVPWTHAGSVADWEAGIRGVYGEAAAPVLKLAATEQLHDPAARARRLSAIHAHWDEILALRAQLPTRATLEAAYAKMPGQALPREGEAVGVDPDLAAAGLRWARDLRSRYTVLRLYEDLGLVP